MFSSGFTPTRRVRGTSIDGSAQAPTINIEAEEAQSEAEDYESSPEDNSENVPINSILCEDPFSNESSRILFDSIDQLRRCGAGQDLDLPQLVIVGKQSAGKSSLLQSLTDIPFPVGSRLCTQFAMRIVSRRTSPGSSDMIEATIETGDVNPFSTRDDFDTKDFKRSMTSMTAEEFEEVINEAKIAMGLDSSQASDVRNYSSKVLKIELSGPRRSHFAILDLPGIFSALVGGVSKRERDGVTMMVSSYMKKPENIIICVADASGDISNEQILPLASTVDSSRLVGVFTKCDRSDNPSDIVKLVRDREGIPDKTVKWFVVHNRGPQASASYDREHEENTTFGKDPWTEVPEEQRGTAMLKKHLANLLCQRIRDAFPGMLNTVTKLLEAERTHRQSFGEPRNDHSQKLSYLASVVGRFQTLALQSLRSPGDLPSDSMKLRGLSEKEKAAFAEDIMENGECFKFLKIGEDVVVPQKQDDSDLDSDDGRLETLNTPNYHGSGRRQRGLMTPLASPSRRNRPAENKTPPRTQLHPLYAEIRHQLATNRGEELPGMLNPAVLRPLWRKQTSKWQDLSQKHLEQLVSLTTNVALKLFHQACLDVGTTDRVKNGLEVELLSFAESSRREVMNKLAQMIEKNQTMALQTHNPLFLLKVRESQAARFTAAIDRYRRACPPVGFLASLVNEGGAPKVAIKEEGYADWAIVNKGHLEALFNELHPSGERKQNVEDEVHDLLKAYYDVTLQNHIYDVSHNITEPFLLSPTGPLLGLNTDFIMSLPQDVIDQLGGEDESVVIGRREAESRVRRLEEAVTIAGGALGRTRGVVGGC
ncbi:P-loop containing nucleoside triphosphate hydrolase protein [Halenospora varia]|nr:P-loop containing nucleoside triphosphate hydrolase protein [Halenospora varia]